MTLLFISGWKNAEYIVWTMMADEKYGIGFRKADEHFVTRCKNSC